METCMNNERISRIRSAMEAERLDAIVCRLPENVLFLSGYWPVMGWSFYYLPLEGNPTCIVPDIYGTYAGEELWDAELETYPFATLDAGNPYELIAKLLRDASSGTSRTRIGYEGSFETIAPPWDAAEAAVPAAVTRSVIAGVFSDSELVDCTDLLHTQRGVKTAWEIDKMRRACEISVFGLKAFQEAVEPGISGVELAALVEQAVMIGGTGYKGARRVRAFAQVFAGPEEMAVSAIPMFIPTKRPMQDGDSALLELGVVADGYWSDRTRVRIAGTPSDEQLALFDVVRRAQEAAIGTVRSGVTAGFVDEAARSVIREAGYEKEFFHVTGHGVGFRYHEPIPLIAPGSDFKLEAGMTHTVEPGIYSPVLGGMRIEENVVVTDTGADVLGPCRKSIA